MFIQVDKDRTNTVLVDFGYDISNDTITSQIRKNRNSASTLIAEWEVSFITDGTDGKLKLVLDNSVTSSIFETHGWMDFKRVTNSEPLSMIKQPIRVIFQDVVTE
jgi:hypothetical protein